MLFRSDRAQKLLIEAEIRSAADIPIVTKKFRDVAKLTLLTMDQEEKRGKVPVSYKDYRRIINDYLIQGLETKVCSIIASGIY